MTSGEELRHVLRQHAAGVSVLTVDLDGERIGVTVASLVSLALEPPLVGVSIAHSAAVHELLRAAGGFGISMLSAEQVPLAQHFARGVPPIAQWQGIEVLPERRVPLLAGALGWLECDLEAEHPAGDHTFFVARVSHAEAGPGAPSLVRVRGDYGAA